jgi:AraC family transcriptional activator of mtrCDE
MLSRRKTYAGRIKHPDDATESATLDPLGAIAPLFGAAGLCSISHRDQWKLPAGAVFRGNVQAGSRQHPPAPAGRPPRREIGEPWRKHRSADQNRIQQRDQDQNQHPRRERHRDDLRPAAAGWGHGAMYSLVTAALPKAIVLNISRGDLFDRMRMLVQAIDEELQAARPGAATIATELATALFVMMLRLHFEQSASPSGIIRLLASSSSARAVTAMLRAPAHPWTLDELAAEAHVSRATLVRIFRREGDIAPLGFLCELRLGLARQRLNSTTGTLAQVAAAVGYDSESSFVRAFRKRYGISPGRLRVRDDGRSRGETHSVP